MIGRNIWFVTVRYRKQNVQTSPLAKRHEPSPLFTQLSLKIWDLFITERRKTGKVAKFVFFSTVKVGGRDLSEPPAIYYLPPHTLILDLGLRIFDRKIKQAIKIYLIFDNHSQSYDAQVSLFVNQNHQMRLQSSSTLRPLVFFYLCWRHLVIVTRRPFLKF